MTAETITQYLVRIPTSDPKAKRAALRALVGREDVRNGIVFCNRKSEVDVVAKSLKQHGFDAAPIHGDLDQSLRTKTLADFRSGALKILVASDVAARGLDIPDVSHVFNYDVSHHADDYVHRIGRTGRAGKLGQAFMLVTPADDKGLDKVLKLIKMAPEELKLDIDWSNLNGSAPRREAPAREASGRDKPDGRSRGRAVRAEAPVETIETEIAASPVASPIAATDEAPARRTRSRRTRGGEKAVVAEAAAAAAPAAAEARAEAPVPARVETTSAEPAAHAEHRPGREPQLRQADRAGASKDRELPPAREGSGFGNDIPAFLRRPVPARA
jgi:superfamily II DNA/RNA helicase